MPIPLRKENGRKIGRNELFTITRSTATGQFAKRHPEMQYKVEKSSGIRTNSSSPFKTSPSRYTTARRAEALVKLRKQGLFKKPIRYNRGEDRSYNF